MMGKGGGFGFFFGRGGLGVVYDEFYITNY